MNAATMKTATKRVAAVSAALAGVGGSAVVFPEPASAHVFHFSHADVSAQLRANHESYYACHLGISSTALLEYFVVGSTTRHIDLWSGGCINHSAGGEIRQIRICINSSDCGAWKRGSGL